MDAEADRRYCLFMARLAQEADRYDEMATYMKKLTKLAMNQVQKPTKEERTLLSVAYKTLISSKRNSLMSLIAVEKRAESDLAMKTEKNKQEAKETGSSIISDPDQCLRESEVAMKAVVEDERELCLVRYFREKVEGEIAGICGEVLKLLEAHVLPVCNEMGLETLCDDTCAVEMKVFFYKMKGDYLRYLAQVLQDGVHKETTIQAALSIYQSAQHIADMFLPNAHLSRLGLALNFSVLYADVLGMKECGVALAKKTMELAIPSLDCLDGKTKNEAKSIINVLEENVNLWSLSKVKGYNAL